MKIFLLIIFTISIFKYGFSYNLFDTNFYDVDFISDKIEDEKIKKINLIKENSIKKILKKTLNIDEFDKISKNLSQDLINTFIKSLEINNEKILNNRYISEIKINFDKKKIINYFRQQQIPYVEYLPNKILLIINEEDEINSNLLSNNNKFYSYFKKNITDENIFQLPNLDINDRYILTIKDIKIKDLNKINNFSKKYNLDNLVIANAKIKKDTIDYNIILYSNGENYQNGLSFTDSNLNNFFKNLEIRTLDMWKKINEIQNYNTNVINCKINYFNMYELREIRNKIKNISIIENFKIKSLSYKAIEYDIYYYGNLKILKNIFTLKKLEIKYSQDSCVISLI